jgi:membrane protein implicated in regulation of membrane protease activity
MTMAGWIYRAAFGCSALAVERTVTVLVDSPGLSGVVLSLVFSMLAIGTWLAWLIRRCFDRLAEKPVDREKQRQAAALVAAVDRAHLRSVR